MYTFSSTGLAAGFTVPANTALTGDGSQGPQQTVFRIAAVYAVVAILIGVVCATSLALSALDHLHSFEACDSKYRNDDPRWQMI